MISAVPGVVSATINGGAACMVVEYDGEARTRSKVLDLLEDIPREAYLPEAVRDEPIALSTVVSKSATALATPFLPSVIKAPLAVLMGLPVMAEGVRTLFSRGVKVEVLDAAAVGFSLLRGDYATTNAIVAMLGTWRLHGAVDPAEVRRSAQGTAASTGGHHLGGTRRLRGAGAFCRASSR